jgi:hypothetical protein
VAIAAALRVTLSGSLSVPRFNMPFELGIAFALAQSTSHRIFAFEEKERRIDDDGLTWSSSLDFGQDGLGLRYLDGYRQEPHSAP